MSFDFDGFNRYKPVLGQVAQAGQTEGVWHQCTVICKTASAINNATATWKHEESDDGTTYTDVTATTPAIYRVPTSGTGSIFHASTQSKKAYAKLTLMDNGSAVSGATYIVLLGKPATNPFLGSLISGIEDGYATAPTK